MIQTVGLISFLASICCLVLFAEEFSISKKFPKGHIGILSALGLIAAFANCFIPAGNLASFSSGLLLTLFLLLCLLKGGVKNGGADQMTGLLLLCLFAMRMGGNESQLTKAALYLLGIQTGLSYFVAGFVKASNRSWWDGSAVKNLAKLEKYPLPENFRKQITASRFLQKSSGGLVIFELCFPLAFVNTQLASGFLLLGAVFHLFNAYALGLNRFFWSWIAAYPAVFYCAIDFHR